jgi:hypothetical protein
MVTGFGTLQRRAGSALEHLTEAISLDSASGWYALEAYFVERALGRPKKALERLDSAIGLLGPMPLLAEALKAHRGSVLP